MINIEKKTFYIDCEFKISGLNFKEFHAFKLENLGGK